MILENGIEYQINIQFVSETFFRLPNDVNFDCRNVLSWELPVWHSKCYKCRSAYAHTQECKELKGRKKNFVPYKFSSFLLFWSFVFFMFGSLYPWVRTNLLRELKKTRSLLNKRRSYWENTNRCQWNQIVNQSSINVGRYKFKLCSVQKHNKAQQWKTLCYVSRFVTYHWLKLNVMDQFGSHFESCEKSNDWTLTRITESDIIVVSIQGDSSRSFVKFHWTKKVAKSTWVKHWLDKHTVLFKWM